MYAGVPDAFGLGLEDDSVLTFWLRTSGELKMMLALPQIPSVFEAHAGDRKMSVDHELVSDERNMEPDQCVGVRSGDE